MQASAEARKVNQTMKSVFWVAAIACACGGVAVAPARALVMTAHMSAAATEAQAEPWRAPRALVDTGAGKISDRPNWFKTPDKTGYGWRNGATETTFGLYRLPPTPDLPAPKISPEAKGAAGVSFSITLGG